jgi:hypothetical protein
MGQRLAADFQNIIQKYCEHAESLEPPAKKKREDTI